MIEDARIIDEISAPETASKPEVSLAAEIMLVMVKASKGAKMYQANNPILGKFFQELVEKMSMMLNLYSEYKLDVDRFELQIQGTSAV